MSASEDRDWSHLDRVIGLALDIIKRANSIKDRSDDPDIVYWGLLNESAGLVIQADTITFRGRVRELKELEALFTPDEIEAARARKKKKTRRSNDESLSKNVG